MHIKPFPSREDTLLYFRHASQRLTGLRIQLWSPRLPSICNTGRYTIVFVVHPSFPCWARLFPQAIIFSTKFSCQYSWQGSTQFCVKDCEVAWILQIRWVRVLIHGTDPSECSVGIINGCICNFLSHVRFPCPEPFGFRQCVQFFGPPSSSESA